MVMELAWQLLILLLFDKIKGRRDPSFYTILEFINTEL